MSADRESLLLDAPVTVVTDFVTGLFASDDLLDARVRHSRCGSDRAVAVAVSDGFTDSDTPLVLCAGAAHRGPSETDERVHLLAEAEQGCLVGLVAAVPEGHPLADDGFALSLDLRGLTAEDGACVADGFSACHGVGHMARILATERLVKGTPRVSIYFSARSPHGCV